MRRFSSRITPFFFLAFLMTMAACTRPQQPDPSMTAVATRPAGGASLDWISPEDVRRASELGLLTRGSGFGGEGENGERIEGLLPSVFFDFDQSFVRPADRPALQEAAEFLRRNPNARSLLEGHCDWRGTTEYNLALGDRRARSVREYLEQIGVDPERLETVSKGDLNATQGGSEQDMARDRRVDLIVFR